jgi:hypothetical protein
MVIKGSARGATKADGIKLAKHLVSSENETVSIVAMNGVAATDLASAIEEMRLLAAGTRARQALYHASINLDRAEAPTLTREQWLEAACELGKRLGMEENARLIVQHVKRGRPHIHVVWSRVHPVSLKLARDSHNYRTHEQTSRFLEEKWRLRPVDGAFTRPKGTPRPVAIATHKDWQAAERTGVRVADVADRLKQAWDSTTTARAFQRAVEAEGWHLARGRRACVVLVDHAGTPHSIPRRLQVKAAIAHRRLKALTGLPTVEEAKATGRNVMPKKTAYGAARRRRDDRDREPIHPLSPDYWKALGYEVEAFVDHLAVKLSPTTTLLDHGDRMVLDRAGEPTDEEIRLLVTAGRERGWTEIRFFGGSADFQKRARLEALRQGYRLDQISLECEDGKPKPLAAVPMPEHIRAKLLPAEPEPTPAAPTPELPAPAAPAPEFRP